MRIRVLAHWWSLRLILGLTISVSLLLTPNASLLFDAPAVRAQNEAAKREGRSVPGKPEGVFPDLDDTKNESHLEREPAAPIPSTLRSPKVPLQPWNGRRVGDLGARGELGQVRNRLRRAHAKRSAPPPTVLDDQFIANFFAWTVLRSPNGTEPTYWSDQLRVAYAQGQTSLKLAAVELGKTLFESAEYAARQRNNSEYVYDLYQTYLRREPDSAGWTHWTGEVPNNGRENVRRAFEECFRVCRDIGEHRSEWLSDSESRISNFVARQSEESTGQRDVGT
ncbi:MAG TPA: DUF4214 domain-containing protein [Pyrinomonadaceae bacterium]|nr:DUF4214 domain-containing protein [Pyrinomonadaceae bacterium]